MAVSNDTSGVLSERFASFHTPGDEAFWRNGGKAERLRALMLDTQAPPLDLAALVEARAQQLMRLLDVFSPGLDDGIGADEVVSVLYPTVHELHALTRVLALRISEEAQSARSGAE